MELLTFLLGLGVGAAIWYGVFYFRYEDTKSVDWLRGDLGQTIDDNLRLSSETKELTEQNLILKEKVTELLMKNSDLNSIVWELNRYYFYLKEWYGKATELVNMLKWVDPAMEEKIKKIVNSMEHSPDLGTPWGYKGGGRRPGDSSGGSGWGVKSIPISDKPAW
jgi:hypothetical protein